MTKRNFLLTVSAVIGSIALAATLGARASRGTSSGKAAAETAALTGRAEPAALAFSLREGTARAYRWAMTATVSPASPGAAPPGDTSWDGTLNVRVVPRAVRPTLAVQVSPLRVRVMGQPNPRMENVFSTPFLVEIEPDGRLGATRFRPDVAPADRASLDAAVRSLEVILPLTPAKRWETTEMDQNGDYLASYEVEVPSGDIVKRKVRYAPRPASPFSAAVEASSVRAQVDLDGPWLARSKGTEQLVLGSGTGQALARVHARFLLEPLPVPPDAGLALWRDEDLALIRAGVADGSTEPASAWDEEERARVRAQFRRDGVTLVGLIAALASNTHDTALPRRIAAYLRAFPEETAAVPEALRALHDPGAAQLLGALQVSGSPQAQAALGEVFESKRQPRENRLRALFALAAVEHPTADTVGRVSRAAGRPRGGTETREISSTALLVLGALAQKAPDQLGSHIIRLLEDGLRAATAPQDERLFLLALGNARANLTSDALRAYLRSSSAEVREAATTVVANGSEPGTTAELVALLAREEEAKVRLAVVEGLLLRPPDGGANDAIARALAEGREPEARVRTRMVAFLARQMKEFPENRQALEAQLKRETSREVVVAILNSLVR